MLVAEKKHHIESHIVGEGADYLITILKQKLPDLVVLDDEDDEEFIECESSEWFKRIGREMTPGKVLRIRRENKELTQTALSKITGIPVPNISLMENDKRGIGMKTAKILAKALDCSVSDFV